MENCNVFSFLKARRFNFFLCHALDIFKKSKWDGNSNSVLHIERLMRDVINNELETAYLVSVSWYKICFYKTCLIIVFLEIETFIVKGIDISVEFYKWFHSQCRMLGLKTALWLRNAASFKWTENYKLLDLQRCGNHHPQ